MTGWAKNILVTAPVGPVDGPPILFLHDRYGDYPDGLALANALDDEARKMAVRSARTQLAGTDVIGYFWFLGPLDRPELTTLGDALYHLETLILELEANSGQKVGVIGIGEGGVMALLMALIWPDVLSRVGAFDAALPTNLADLPIQIRPLAGLPILLASGTEQAQSMRSTAAQLSAMGGAIETIVLENGATAAEILAGRWPGGRLRA